MLFNSFEFAVLLLLTFALYYLPIAKRHQVRILVLSSLTFYAFEEFTLLFLLLFSAALNIVSSYYIAFGPARYRKLIAVLGVVVNLSVLAFFKYSSLISYTFFEGDNSIGRMLLSIPLPIGISFFTFEGISLLIDVFKNDTFNSRKLIPPSLIRHGERTIFFISFFPHLVAGPILKAHDFYPQIREKHFKDIKWEVSFRKLVLGYFLKMVVADNLKDFTFRIAYPYFKSQSTANLLAMLFGYSFQIFADFAGYSLIAIGLAGLFGYRFNENFNFPYIASSFKEFWKRWHISLSSFLMEYLYFPLGGNRKGKLRTYFNLMTTMILGGLWHGAAWSYAIWGAIHGLALALERMVSDKFRPRNSPILQILKTIMVFFLVTLAWLLFKLSDFRDVMGYFEALDTNWSMRPNVSQISYILLYSLPVLLYHFLYLLRDTRIFSYFKGTEAIWYAILLALIILNSGTSGSFIYFQF